MTHTIVLGGLKLQGVATKDHIIVRATDHAGGHVDGNLRLTAEEWQSLVALSITTAAVEEKERELAGAHGELDGLRVSEAFHRDRCDKLEMAVVRKLLPKEQDSFKGCCPLCATRDKERQHGE